MDANEPQVEVFFLPLALVDDLACGDVDAGVLSRRIPGFLELLLNRGESGPVDTLEMHTDPEDGPAQWVYLQEPPDSEETFEHLDQHVAPRAVINGVLGTDHDGIRIELSVHFAADRAAGISTTLRGVVPIDNPVPALLRLAERLARLLELPPPRSWARLTSSGPAFFKFLQGLDGVVLLGSDLPIEHGEDAAVLLRPFADALQLDPSFGLALRTLQSTMQQALKVRFITRSEFVEIFDRCLGVAPSDGDGCVAVAEHLAGIGESDRAQAWLVHASELDPPPARGLEDLGIMLANRGDTVAARELWMQGVAIDGHPDFFAHLARLAFSEERVADGWESVLRGLRRLYERGVRHGEWDDAGTGAGMLLRYLVDHLRQFSVPAEVNEAVVDLAGVLRDPADRLDLSRCLVVLDKLDEARIECDASLREPLGPDARDQALEVLLMIDVPDFESRFRGAADRVVDGRDLDSAVRTLESMHAAQPGFWPIVFFLGLAQRRRGDEGAAIDSMAEVLRLRPGQSDALIEMAQLFDSRGNAKRALECIDAAIEAQGEDSNLLSQRALFLFHLDRCEEALEEIERAIEEERDPSYVRLRAELERRLA